MSYGTHIDAVADADLNTSGGAGHIVQADGSSSERMDLVTSRHSDTVVGMLTNDAGTAAAEWLDLVYEGWGTAKAGEALEPFDYVISLTDSEVGKYQSGSGAVVIGQYIPEARAGGTNLPDAAAADDVRIFFFGNKTRRADAKVSVKFTYDISGGVDTATAGTHGQGVFLPDNAIVIKSLIDVITTFTSATDAATIAIGTASEVTVDAAIAISNVANPWDAGIRDGDHDGAGANAEKTSSEQEVNVVVATETLTAGKLVCFIDYYISE